MTGEFAQWFTTASVLIIDDGCRCEGLRAWLVEAGATVTRTAALQQAFELSYARPARFDVALIDADAHPNWERFAERVPCDCALLVVSASAHTELLQTVRRAGAGYVSRHLAHADFLFAVQRLLPTAAPELDRLVARSARVWELSPRLTRLLRYNLWGYPDRDIAREMGITLKTAQQYQEELRRKTGVKTKQSYLRRLLALAGHEPLLPMSDESRLHVDRDRARLLALPDKPKR